MDRRFENPFARQLYIEVSGICDVKKIKREYISVDYIWKIWQKVYKRNFGCTKYYIFGDNGYDQRIDNDME